MSNSPTTRISLLLRLRDTHDLPAWDRFVGLYAPLVYGFARRKGLQDADAAVIAQRILGRVQSLKLVTEDQQPFPKPENITMQPSVPCKEENGDE